METSAQTASVILAAGRGSRMKEFEGNKTLLPLIPGSSPLEGTRPILLQILSNLPAGPKALVVHHKKQDVIRATRSLDITYCEQPVLDGTGGGLLAARKFLENQDCDQIIITMGDVPFVTKGTYNTLLSALKKRSLVVLGFRPPSKKQYGVLELKGSRVQKIIEWKYWKTFSKKRQQALDICNSGIYAASRDHLIQCLSLLASRPHLIQKEIDGKLTQVEEFFITDIVEYMYDDGLAVGYILAEDKEEVMGIDDLEALLKAQKIFQG